MSEFITTTSEAIGRETTRRGAHRRERAWGKRAAAFIGRTVLAFNGFLGATKVEPQPRSESVEHRWVAGYQPTPPQPAEEPVTVVLGDWKVSASPVVEVPVAEDVSDKEFPPLHRLHPDFIDPEVYDPLSRGPIDDRAGLEGAIVHDPGLTEELGGYAPQNWDGTPDITTPTHYYEDVLTNA